MHRDFKFIPQFLTDEEVLNPYVAASKFYHLYDLEDVRGIIAGWMSYIYTPPNWNKKSPSNLLSFYEELLGLIEVCWLIKKMDNRERLARIDETDKDGENLLNPDLYCPSFFRDFPWGYFPRSLSWTEYLNPYKVFKGFFKFHNLKEWKVALNDLLHYAFVGRSLQPASEVIDLIGFKKHLDKLTEAVHLIHIREFEWKDGALTRKTHKAKENEEDTTKEEGLISSLKDEPERSESVN